MAGLGGATMFAVNSTATIAITTTLAGGMFALLGAWANTG